MTSKQVYDYIKNDKVSELYKVYKRIFDWIDKASEDLLTGDNLDEFELAQNIDRATGAFAKLKVATNALESYMYRLENNTYVKELDSYEKIRIQDKDVSKVKARNAVCDVKDWYGDFSAYTDAAQQIITSAQSRIKRLVVEDGGRGVGFRGDSSNVPEAKKNNAKKWE